MMCPLFCAFAEEAPLDEGDIPLEIIQYDPTDYFIDGNGQFTFLIGKGFGRTIETRTGRRCLRFGD